MKLKKLVEKSLNGLRMALAGIALVQFSVGAPGASAQQPGPSGQTTTPIKHVIVIIGENRSFDHVFATYIPKNGQTVDNLLATPSPWGQAIASLAAFLASLCGV
jgi:phospholipase C